MVRVSTGSRLHFGLISLAGEGQRWLDHLGAPGVAARRFGGVGLMIDAPGVAVRVEPADAWSAEGLLAERAMGFARQVASGLGETQPRRVVVERAAPQHAGFGTGTQLALAVARALSWSWGRDDAVTELARVVGRGRRSGLGVHGFERGGFLVDGGKGEGTTLAPLLARVPFPEAWRVVVALPPQPSVYTGCGEQAAFDRLFGNRVEATGHLCRLVMLGLLPALIEADLDVFGEAVFDFNARAGELFALVQGGVYASAEVAAIVEWLRGQGVSGAGQSSWGPAVFGVVGDPERGEWVRRRLGEAFPSARTWLSAAVCG